VLSGLVQTLAGAAPREDQEEPVVTIDYREATPSEAWADRVKELYDQGKLIKAIAAELGITRNLAAQALDCWYQQRGLAKPDGRSRRATLDQKHLRPPRYVQLAEEAMRLSNAGRARDEIAARLNCSRPTITKAINHWHQSRGLSAPAGRTRRQESDGSSVRPEVGGVSGCDAPPPAA
jgi:transposase